MATISIERIEQQMKEGRAARMRGDPAAQGDQTFGTPPGAIVRSLRKMVFSFVRRIGGKDTEVQVVPEELVGSSSNCLARRLRFEQTRPDCGIQRVVVAFLTPVKVDREGITVETEGRDVRGRRRIQQMLLDPFLPFRGDKKARRQMKDFGARYIK